MYRCSFSVPSVVDEAMSRSVHRLSDCGYCAREELPEQQCRGDGGDVALSEEHRRQHLEDRAMLRTDVIELGRSKT